MNENEFVGKKVVVVKTDKFRKIGICKEITPYYIILERYDGVIELIPMSSVSSIEEDKGGSNA